jgi:hypothetical protein
VMVRSRIALGCMALAGFWVVAMPVAAQGAPAYWYKEEAKVTGITSVGGKTEFFLSGSLSGTSFSVNCLIEYEASVSNEPAGSGEVENVAFTFCFPSIPGEAYEHCTVALSGAAMTWPILALSGGSTFTVSLLEVDVKMIFGTEPEQTPACGIGGNTYFARGNLAGDWENGNPSLLRFKETSGLSVYFNEAGIGSAVVTADFNVFGEAEGEGEGEGEITLKTS